MVVIAAIGWWAFLTQIVLGRPFGEDPASDALIWVVFVVQAILVPVVLWRLRLETTVTTDHVRVRFVPFRAREVPVDAIMGAATTGYKALRDYGGYGYRRTASGEIAFIVSGDRAVELIIGGGDRLVVGSQRPDELVTAIERARHG